MKTIGNHPHQLVGLVGLVMSCGKVFFGLSAMKLGENISKMAITGLIAHGVGKCQKLKPQLWELPRFTYVMILTSK